ncbi:MAG TPA: OmpA family protein [Polyangiaceae bacterium]|nr:OmpA family protein [Polyangiaceae bacterium]
MKNVTRLYFGASALALAASACGASAPTPELMTARNVYSQARSSEASQLNPRGVHEAHKALSAAEQAHADDPGSDAERHYSYIATRKSELAIAQASESLAHKEQQRAEQDYQSGLERRSEQMAQQSSQYSQQLTQTQEQLQASSEELRAREQKLAELQAASERAQDQLRKMEAIREEEGRMIISLSGVLFETGGNQLSAPAQSKLDTVAQALAAYPDRNIVIEGHTDAKGSDTTNQELSQRRADAVRTYLEARGVPAERMRSIGRGESDPIASNDTAEGRANNRRVEVIVEPAQQQRTSSTQPSTSTGAQSSAAPPDADEAPTPPDTRTRTSSRQQ